MLRALQQAAAGLAAAGVRRRLPSTAACTPPAAAYSSSALEWLDRFVNYEQRGVPQAAGTDSEAGFDLGRMHRLLADLGDPHHSWKAVHVAGTKGKGSTTAMVASILQQAGYRAGAYTSPHISAFNERIAVSGRPIPDAELDALVACHAGAIEAAQQREGGALSHFEIVTALAFKHFQEQQVDAAVIEVGLGGIRDATNVLPPASVAAAVITAVGHDHAAALGGGIEQIAAAKAGIMKAGRPVVLARQPEAAAEAVLLHTAQELGCPVIDAPQDVQFLAAAAAEPGANAAGGSDNGSLPASIPPQLKQQTQMMLSGTTAAALLGPESPAQHDVSLRLLGAHQLENAAAAVAAAGCLRQQGFDRISLQSVAAGLEAATLPGRFQLCQLAADAEEAAAAATLASQGGSGSSTAGPWVVLDGAHTAESARALALTLRAAFPTAPVAVVLAMAEDKQHREFCQELRAIQPAVVLFTQVAIAGGAARAASPGQLAAAWQAAAITGSPGLRPRGGMRTRELIQASLTAAVEKARMELRAHPQERGVVLVCGSLHAVGAALRQLPLVPAA